MIAMNMLGLRMLALTPVSEIVHIRVCNLHLSGGVYLPRLGQRTKISALAQ